MFLYDIYSAENLQYLHQILKIGGKLSNFMENWSILGQIYMFVCPNVI